MNDLYICGSCSSQFTVLELFLEHKKKVCDKSSHRTDVSSGCSAAKVVDDANTPSTSLGTDDNGSADSAKAVLNTSHFCCDSRSKASSHQQPMGLTTASGISSLLSSVSLLILH